MIRGRLFWKIYLTLLACLAAVLVASAIYWSAGRDRDGWTERRDRFIGEMLPANADPAALQGMLESVKRAFGTDVAIYAADGKLIAAAGAPPPRPDPTEWQFGHRPDVFQLSDGRTVVADLDMPDDEDGPGAVGYLALIVTVIGAVAYPVVRHLTRRLESLRDGVEKFGAGALGARVDVKGKDEVAAVAASFNRAAERIEKLVTAHRALLANASHELRSPLTRLRMAIDLRQAQNVGPDKEIIDNLGEIDELVEEILLASRLNHIGRLERVENVDLTALVAEECARYGIEASGSAVHVSGDARLMTRVVRNLVGNALRHGAPPVEVQIEAAGPRARLRVSDHGAGLPTGAEAKIFEPFYRPPGRSEAAGGWGLGLALVKQIAELHGGTVRYESRQGGGASFVVELPASRI